MASVGRATRVAWQHASYLLVALALASSVPAADYSRLISHVTLAIGAIGLWRYSWGALHLVRSLIYGALVFPRIRRQANLAGATGAPRVSFLLVTSYRIPADTTLRVYRAAIAAALAAPGHTTIVASIVEMADQRLIKALFRSMTKQRDDVDLVFVRIAGTGKRDALACGFRAIARRRPPADALVAVIDGDSMVPPELVKACWPYFAFDRRIGALTTDEIADVRAGTIFRHWYDLRFAQRHILMSSMGLSRKVLTLTGRMSMFRASIVCNADFIRQVETDYIDHWRFGRFRFLTGDDKSTWYWLLKNNYDMLYVPDLVVTTVEEPPSPSFTKSAAVLMRRWYGNMLRTNGRALALGPGRLGFFVWWTILDQRLSMWTCLVGVMMAVLGTVFLTPYAIVVYLAWVMLSRYVLALTLLTARPKISIAYPFLLYFNQVFGAVIKTYVLFRLQQQKWTRQNTVLEASLYGRWRRRLEAISSNYLHGLSLSMLVVFAAWLSGILV